MSDQTEAGCCGPATTGIEAPAKARSAARTTPENRLPIVVIGAGPVGLAAAAHLVERGLDFLVLEAG
ncbi:MAG: NAD(P)-binding protein, partial [Streptosporangiaceae bacterium]